MSAATYLANYGVTVDQARDFIWSHIGQPQTILDTARQYGITNDMLGEIAGGYSGDQVKQFFSGNGMSAWDLDAQSVLPGDIAQFDRIVSLDTATDALSVASLRAQVVAATGQTLYNAAFDPSRFAGSDDGVFTVAELGTSKLGDVVATRENIESIFYGSIIRLAATIDADEFSQVTMFMQQHGSQMDTDPAVEQQFQTMMLGVIEDDAASPCFSPEQVMHAAIASGIAVVQALGQGQHGLFDELLTGFGVA
jgi:hypothetical protein